MKIPNDIDWKEIKALAERQGLSAIVLDGIEEVRSQMSDVRCNLPDKFFLTQWIGEVLQGYEYRYKLYCRAIAELASFYNSHSYKMMVLKGYACSLNWPKPEHRPCGDIDIWLFGQQKEADKFLESLEFRDESSCWGKRTSSSVETVEKVKSVKKIKVDRSHHHHTVFFWRDFMVENHYDFVNVHARRSSAEMEKVFKELGSFKVESGEFSVEGQLNGCSVEGCKIPCVEILGEKVYLPSANLHALFLIKHMVSHFAASEISLRQVLDWAFFVEKHTNEIDWDWLNDKLNEYGMSEFYNIINAICIEDLGFDADLFHNAQYNLQLKDRVLADIVNPAFETIEPNEFIAKWTYKIRRWKGNAWKHNMCYKESRWSAFWSGVWNHLLKPSSV